MINRDGEFDIVKKGEKEGSNRELNPGPLANHHLT